MRRALVMLVVLVLGAAGVLAQESRSPEAVVAEIYDYYHGGGAIGVWPTDPVLRPLFTERLMGLLDADDELAAREGIGRLGFDPFVDGQDFALENLAIVPRNRRGESALVEVTFTNFGQETRLLFTLMAGDGVWRIDEIEAPDGHYPWRLGDVLLDD